MAVQTDSIQYVYNGQSTQYYRWDLKLIRDVNNNEATINYLQDKIGTSPQDSVRSAYPEYLNYSNDTIKVHFISSFQIQDPTDGNLRRDNPKTYGSNPAPKIMENRSLDAIEIKVNENLLRKYSFAHNTIPCGNPNSNPPYQPYSYYGGVYYSGKFTLSSITQIGADNTSQLPPITFNYADNQIYRTNYGLWYGLPYVGNPGDPCFDLLAVSNNDKQRIWWEYQFYLPTKAGYFRCKYLDKGSCNRSNN